MRLLGGAVVVVLPLVLTALPARGAEGDLDVDSFGYMGIARTGVYSSSLSSIAVAIQVDGKILLAGVDGSSHEDFVARFESDGRLDAGFGSGGVARTGVSSGDDSGVAVAIQVDGKILVAGVDSTSHEDFVMRFDSSGTLDAGFGSSGIARTGVFSGDDSSVAVAIQSDDKILLAGVDSTSHEDFVARFDSTGTLETRFGSSGIAHTGVFSSSTSGIGVAIQSDWKILVAGMDGSSDEDFVARFDSSGTLDAGFGSSGIAYTGFLSYQDSSVDVAVQSDGKILLAGVDGTIDEYFVARFIGTPVPVTPVPTLNAPGFVLLALLMLFAVALVAGKKQREFTAPKEIAR